MNTPPLVPVVELLRVSTESQAGEDRAGLPAQHAVNLRTCETYGLRVVETVEVVVSGAAVVGTAAMDRVLACVTSGRARGIVVAEYSRLFRPDRWSDLAILQVFEEHAAQIYVPAGPIDLGSEIGFVQASVNNLLAAIERRRIKERMSRGKEELRRRGAHVAGGIGLPYGVAYSKKDGWSYTADIEVVRELFRRFLAGERNYDALGRSLGLPRTSTKVILRNPVYTGWRVYTERRGPGYRKTMRAPNEVIRVRLPLEPVVSEEDFALIQQIIATKQVSHTRKARDSEFVYRGFLACAHDGLAIYTHSAMVAGGRRLTYFCRSHHPVRRPEGVEKCTTGYMIRDRVEAVLDAAVSERLTDAEVLMQALSAYEESRSATWRSSAGDAEALERRVAQMHARRDRVLELFVDGNIDRAEKDRRLGSLTQEIAAAEAALAAARPTPAAEVTPEDVLAIVSAFAEWSFLARLERRRVLESLSPTFYIRRLPGKRGRFAVDGVRFPFAGLSGMCDSGGRL